MNPVPDGSYFKLGKKLCNRSLEKLPPILPVVMLVFEKSCRSMSYVTGSTEADENVLVSEVDVWPESMCRRSAQRATFK